MFGAASAGTFGYSFGCIFVEGLLRRRDQKWNADGRRARIACFDWTFKLAFVHPVKQVQ